MPGIGVLVVPNYVGTREAVRAAAAELGLRHDDPSTEQSTIWGVDGGLFNCWFDWPVRDSAGQPWPIDRAVVDDRRFEHTIVECRRGLITLIMNSWTMTIGGAYFVDQERTWRAGSLIESQVRVG